jgi:diguanylate cyclase (GGDEF)-like protein
VFERQLEGLHDENIALILIDIDYFKTVNDTLGHDGGDAVLKKVAGQLTKYFRSSDYACRIGGDEFAVILTNIDESLKQVVETKVISLREGMMDTQDGLPEITLSAGIAFSEPNLTSEGLFKHADSALYLVKESGRNGYRFYVDPLA